MTSSFAPDGWLCGCSSGYIPSIDRHRCEIQGNTRIWNGFDIFFISKCVQNCTPVIILYAINIKALDFTLPTVSQFHLSW